MKKIAASGVAAVLLLGALGVGVSPAHAVELRVTSAEDSGPGTLREALSEADASPGEDTIVIAEGLELYPNEAFYVNDAVRIVGEGSGASISLERQAPNADPVFFTGLFSVSAPLAIENMTLNPQNWWVGRSLLIASSWSVEPTDVSIQNSRIIGDSETEGVNLASNKSSLRVVDSTFEGVGRPFSSYAGLQGSVEIARNTFTGVDKLGSFQQGVEASQKFEFVDNVVEFTGSSAGFGAEFLSAMVPTGQAEFDPMVISGNRFFSPAPTGDLNSGATLHLGAYWTPGEVRQTPGIMFVNNSVERHQSSTNTNALLFIESDYTGGIRMSESTFEANPGASSISNNTYGADASVLAIDHVTSRGPIVATFGVNVSISNSAIDGQGSPAVTSGNDAVVIGEGNVVAGESSVLVDAKTVDDLLLGDLADVGLGASFARVPLAGSPVLDAGVAARSVEDQRGVLGTRAGLSDAGSVEVQRALVTVGDAGEVTAGSDARFPVTVVEPGDTSFDVELTTVDGTAVAGSGFTSTTQTVSFAAGETGSKEFSVPTLQASAVDGSEFGMSARVVLGAAELDADSGTALLRASKDPTGPIVDPTVPDPEEPVGPIVDPTVKPTGQNLARTGSDVLVLPWVLGAGLVLMGGAVVLARRKTRNG